MTTPAQVAAETTTATERHPYAPNLVLIRIDETSHYKELYPADLKAAGVEKMWGLYLVDLDRTVADPCFPEKFPVRYEAWTLPDAPVFKRVYNRVLNKSVRQPTTYQKDLALDLIFSNTDDDAVRYFSKRQVAAFPSRNKKKINLYELNSGAEEFEMSDEKWFAAATSKDAHDHLMREAVNYICCPCDLWELATW